MTAPRRGDLVENRYELRDLHGRGAMGDVWTAKDTKLDRTVAVKFLAGRRIGGEDLATEYADWPVETFKGEARAMARVNHSNVAHIYDTGEHADTLYIAMEYVEGGSLADRLTAGVALTLEQTVRWTRHICAGLGAAHLAGVIHRDIKPGNIMIDEQGDAKIVDFGLARFADASLSHIGAGTPLYKAPERWKGKQGTVQSDLYSLGCVMYEMLTGRPPFGTRKDDPGAVMRRHLDEPPVSTQAHRPGIPAALDQIVLGLLTKEPADRPATAGDVARAVDLVQYAPDGPADAPDMAATTHPQADVIHRIREAERRILRLHWEHGPRHPTVIEARTELAELTGRSGDSRGAATLYNQLGRDCQEYFGPYDGHVLDAFEGVARWIGRPGGA
ncbi:MULTISPECIES: serine/threonine-protein kinase [unclassified Streptomyces]|uniref:serine/threonine-protein kinase n=1 Tax=unclassified Streptomyces TaxID=2593676 RepID=UPI0035D92113